MTSLSGVLSKRPCEDGSNNTDGQSITKWKKEEWNGERLERIFQAACGTGEEVRPLIPSMEGGDDADPLLGILPFFVDLVDRDYFQRLEEDDKNFVRDCFFSLVHALVNKSLGVSGVCEILENLSPFLSNKHVQGLSEDGIDTLWNDLCSFLKTLFSCSDNAVVPSLPGETPEDEKPDEERDCFLEALKCLGDLVFINYVPKSNKVECIFHINSILDLILDPGKGALSMDDLQCVFWSLTSCAGGGLFDLASCAGEGLGENPFYLEFCRFQSHFPALLQQLNMRKPGEDTEIRLEMLLSYLACCRELDQHGVLGRMSEDFQNDLRNVFPALVDSFRKASLSEEQADQAHSDLCFLGKSNLLKGLPDKEQESIQEFLQFLKGEESSNSR